MYFLYSYDVVYGIRITKIVLISGIQNVSSDIESMIFGGYQDKRCRENKVSIDFKRKAVSAPSSTQLKSLLLSIMCQSLEVRKRLHLSDNANLSFM